MPGSSASFIGGAIVYSNDEKVRQLGVAQTTLDAHGAVSEQTVIEMARGARERFGVDLAVASAASPGPTAARPRSRSARSGSRSRRKARDRRPRSSAGRALRDQMRTLARGGRFRMIDERSMAEDERRGRERPPAASACSSACASRRRPRTRSRGVPRRCSAARDDAGIDLKWVAPANYHVTLKFLGCTREDAVGAVRDALTRAVAGVAAAASSARRGSARFRRSRRRACCGPGIEAAPCSTSSPGASSAAMAGIGFAAETRRFSSRT